MVAFVQMVRIALCVTVRKGLVEFTVRYGQTSARENPVATGYVSMTTHSIGQLVSVIQDMEKVCTNHSISITIHLCSRVPD